MFFVYLLKSKQDQSWYIGYTTNIKRRVTDHNNGTVCATTAKKHGGWKLIYFECYANKQDALGREKFLKGGPWQKSLKKQLRYYLENGDKGIQNLYNKPSVYYAREKKGVKV